MCFVTAWLDSEVLELDMTDVAPVSNAGILLACLQFIS